MEKEYDQHQVIKAKTLSIDLSKFSIAEQKEHEFEHWVNKTAKLIQRPYYQTFKMVEEWSIEKIIQRYELCTKHAGSMPGNIKWFWLRKKERETK